MAKRKIATQVKDDDWDELPHGLGKRVRLGKATGDDAKTKAALTPYHENVNPIQDSNVTHEPIDKSNWAQNSDVKDEPTENITLVPAKDVKNDEVSEDEAKANILPGARRSTRINRSVAVNYATQDIDANDDSLKQERPSNRQTSRKQVTATSASQSPKKQLPPKKVTVSPTREIPANSSDEATKKERKKKHKYGLTPGETPFPDHVMPTPEACEEVNKILSEAHEVIIPPKVIPAPSLEVTGCGEVPDLLDALLRTLLSAATSGTNSAKALDGLKKKFGVRQSGRFTGSINWDNVYAADVKTIIEAIKSGGLATVKGGNIKKILDITYKRNKARRDALLKEQETGKPAQILGADHETSEQKDDELALFQETLLNLDYISKLDVDEAMEELIKLPGIGVKTASCVILFRMQIPSFAVDTHVHRLCNWLGWVPAGTSRDKTFSHCEVRVPDHLKYSLHQLFIRHGKKCYRCRAVTSAGTQEWDETVCPIEHLVKRLEPKKQPGYKPPAKAQKGGKGKGKKANEEVEDSDVEMSDEE